jgi:hypothetical protein
MKNKGIHIATVTVSTLVSPGSDKAKEVAEAFWRFALAAEEPVGLGGGHQVDGL